MAYAIAINLTQRENNLLPLRRGVEEYVYNVEHYDDLHKATQQILAGKNLALNEDIFCRAYDELNSDGVITMCAIKIDNLNQVQKLYDLINALVNMSSGRKYDYAPPRSFGYVYQNAYYEIYANPMWD